MSKHQRIAGPFRWRTDRSSGRPPTALRSALAALAVLVLVVSTSVQANAQVPPPPPTTASTPAPTPPNTQPTPAPTVTPECVTCGKWIDVNLRKQRLTAYIGRRAVFTTLISSGVKNYPTVTGVFHVFRKLKSDRMTGGVGADHYDLPNVPNVMYFYSGYAIHGTYWHHNFGHPMSHGCINANLRAAAWLYNWTPNGTAVWIHY